MKGKRQQLSGDINNIRSEPYQIAYITKPVKSPSPDKKSANIIASTKSPEMSDIKRKLTPIREQYTIKHQYQHQNKDKQFRTNFTPTQGKNMNQVYQTKNQKPNIVYMKNSSNYQKKLPTSETNFSSPPSNSRARNMKIQIVADYAPEDFEIRQKDSEKRRERSNQRDYDQALRQKDQTIRQLRQIIDMINKNNQNIDEGSQYDRDLNISRKIKQQSQSRAALLIQNQKLLHVIQKNQIKITPTKEQILNREISELKESLKDKEFQIEDSISNLKSKIQHLKIENSELLNQNQKLIKLLKDRDNQERSKSDSLASSILSMPSKSADRQKVTLTKIKQQHQENIQLMKNNFYQDFQQLEIAFQNHCSQIEQKLYNMNSKLAHLQGFTSKLQDRQFDKTKKGNSRQENHKEKERHQQIQSLLLQKYSKYDQQINDQKKKYQKLNQQFERANEYIQQLQNQLRVSSGQIQFRNKESQNQQEMELIQKLMKQKLQLQHSLDSLQEENRHLRDQISIIQSSKDRQIKQSLSKLQESLMSEYVSKMEQDKRKYNQIITELTEKVQQREQKFIEATDVYEKDKIDTQEKVKQAIQLFRKENEAFKSSNLHKSNEIQILREQNTRFRSELISITANRSEQSKNINEFADECQNLRNKCIRLEKQVDELNQEIQQMEIHMKEQGRQKQEIQQQNNQLKVQINEKLSSISQLQESIRQLIGNLDHQKSVNVQLQRRLEQIQTKLANDEVMHYQQITSMQQQITSKSQQLTLATQKLRINEENIKEKIQEVQKIYRLYEELKRQRVSFNDESLEEQLKELKKMITTFELNKNAKFENQIIEDYYRLGYQHQNKIEENVRQLKEIERLKEQLICQQQEKLFLIQKVSLLEKNIQIYERQLKERKIMYEQILQQKMRIEKQAYLIKRIKAEKNNIQEGYNSKIADMNSRIDRILKLERDRAQKWQIQNHH